MGAFLLFPTQIRLNLLPFKIATFQIWLHQEETISGYCFCALIWDETLTEKKTLAGCLRAEND